MYTKISCALVALLSVIQLGALADDKCWVAPPESISKLEWMDMDTDCVTEVKYHIKRELEASLTYIAMGAHFLSAANFRPGVAQLFLKHAGEERQHARALMDYVLMRGYEITKDEIPVLKPVSTTWDNVFQALNTTLKIEKDVRDYFKKIIYVCEGGSDPEHKSVDYHISDFLTGTFLEEQHQGVHEIALLVTKLARMLKNTEIPATFVEIEFDRTLLNH